MTIERAAKAIERLEEGRYEIASREQLARAALGAVEQPTPEMIEAGNENSSLGLTYPDEVEVIWRAMHAAMMKEDK